MAYVIAEKIRSLLKETGYITDTQQQKNFTVEEIVSMLSNPSLAMKTFRLSAFLREMECASCQKTFIAKRMRMGSIQTCSYECNVNYIDKMIFKWTPEEKAEINKFLAQLDIQSVLACIVRKRGNIKVFGLYSAMERKSGCNEFVISQILSGVNKTPSSKTMLRFLNACGIDLQMK